MVGTPYYMSPEQILGVEDIDQRTDVYALAAVTFELLTGRPPYLGNNNFEVLYGHKNTPPPDASSLVKTVNKNVSQVMITGLAKRRDDRYETVDEFVADLETAARAQKIDLAKAFKVGSAPEITAQKTRLVPKMKDAPRAPPQVTKPSDSEPDSVPEASNSDVVSVPGVPMSATGQSGEQKTVIHRFDKNERTYVGRPGEPEGEVETRTSASIEGLSPVSGQLRVVVTAKGRAAAANVFVGGKKAAVTPCTLTLPAGPQRVRIELDGYRSVERWSDVVAGTSTNLRVFLEKA
jgi:serine/threonine protein kinase